MSVLSKRIILISSIFSILFVVLIYTFIPDTLVITNSAIVNCNVSAASRTFNNRWKDIFTQHSDTTFYTDGYIYKIQQPVYNGSHISISHNGKTYFTVLSLLPLASDMLLMQWNVALETGKDPITKFVSYFKAKALQTNMQKIATRLQSYLGNKINVYKYNISYTTLTDTVVVSIKTVMDVYPSTKDIYIYIDTLERYIQTQGAKATNSPMLNITHTNNKYFMMVGLPLNIEIPSQNKIEIKHLLPIKDKTLTAEIRGGSGVINDAHKQIEIFMQDHSLAAPVISFDLLVTNRTKQKDTAKWITRLYYPVD